MSTIVGILTLMSRVNVFSLLINVKMPTIFGILTFISRINVMLSSFEHEKIFCSLGHDLAGKGLQMLTADDKCLHWRIKL